MKDHDGVRALREAGIPVIGDDAELTRPAEVAWAGVPKLPDADEDRRALLEAGRAGPNHELTSRQKLAWASVPMMIEEEDHGVGGLRRLRENDLSRPRGWFLRPVEPEETARLREVAERQVRELREASA